MKMLYYDTGVCPRCKSELTARLKPGPASKVHFGLLGPLMHVPDPGDYTLTCRKCGVKWVGIVSMKVIDMDTYNQLKEMWAPYLNKSPDLDAEMNILEDLESVSGYHMSSKKKKGRKQPTKAGKIVKHIGRQFISTPVNMIKSVTGDLSALSAPSYHSERKSADSDDAFSEEEMHTNLAAPEDVPIADPDINRDQESVCYEDDTVIYEYD